MRFCASTVAAPICGVQETIGWEYSAELGGGLVGVDVQTSSTDLAALECGKQSGLVNVGAAGRY